jgi:uracil-DNA glycosylase family 4
MKEEQNQENHVCRDYTSELFKSSQLTELFYTPSPVINIATENTSSVAPAKGPSIPILFVAPYLSSAEPRTVLAKDVNDLMSKMIKAMGEAANRSRVISFLDFVPAEGQECSLEDLTELQKKNFDDIVLKFRPKIIVPMGALSTNFILGKKDRLSKIHGKIFNKIVARDNTDISVQVVPIFHPEFLIINPNMKRTTWADLQFILTNL